MRVTLQDIAARYGVTKTTVSMALRNSRQVSPSRRQEIQQLARDMGYTPDPFLNRLARYRRQKDVVREPGRIAWLNRWDPPQSLRSYKEFDYYFRAANEAALHFGYQLEEFVWPAGESSKNVQRQLEKLGILGLLIPAHPPAVDWGGFDWDKFSLIRFGMTVPWPDSNLVTADHQRAVVMAMEKIHAYGYERIGLILSSEHDRSMGGNFTGGYQWAQKLLKLRAIPLLDLPFRRSTEGVERYKRNLNSWMKKYQPDAILTHSGEVLRYFRELGYRIPQDVALAGTSVYDIPLDAGIDQHPKAIGRIAAEMLIKQISLNEKGVPAKPCRILIESRWQDGKSLPPKKPIS